MTTSTIGEVLNELRDEFDDITISKIRFLESAGLIEPDRSESGYRRFTPDDVERLRYVLRAQRDRYLPLKVIKDELDRIDAGLAPARAPAPTPHAQPAMGPAPTPDGRGATPVLDGVAPDAQLSARELADAVGVSVATIAELREHGLLRAEEPYDGGDLLVARVAARLVELGLEPRHLRMYRQFAERESALLDQLVAPLLLQRNPDSRRAAVERAELLAELGDELQRQLLARELRHVLRT